MKRRRRYQRRQRRYQREDAQQHEHQITLRGTKRNAQRVREVARAHVVTDFIHRTTQLALFFPGSFFLPLALSADTCSICFRLCLLPRNIHKGRTQEKL